MPEDHFNNQKDLYLMEFIKNQYELSLAVFPNNSQLLLSYALFFMERKKNKGAALKILEKAEKSNPTFDEEFAIFKYKYRFLPERKLLTAILKVKEAVI